MRILNFGGAGFIGINATKHFLEKGDEVIVVDNLSRRGSRYNIECLQKLYRFEFIEADIRDFDKLRKVVNDVGKIDVVLLLAGQVAVTTSVVNPREDFEINALGVFNILESIRFSKYRPLIIYSSTNKVYGKMEDVKVALNGKRYQYVDYLNGISETRQLDFYSPYGCSKGCGDQYVHDYFRIYDMPTVVFRQSCIYGENQFGIEDQGWVAWFTIATLLNKRFTIYGDGNQVRDVLFCKDLIDLYDLAIQKPEICSGKAYNVGGGVESTLSLNELIALLEIRFEKKLNPEKAEWRPGDQMVYISDITKVKSELGWFPKISVQEGIEAMASWIFQNKEILEKYTFGK